MKDHTFTKRTAPLAAALFLFAGAHTQAAPNSAVSYDYAGVEYVEQDLDDYDCNQDGLSAYGSMTINGPWFAVAEVTDVSGNKGCGSSTLAAGGGYHTPLNSQWDLYGTLSVERTDPDNGSSDTGLVAAAGARGWLLQRLEGKAELAHHTAFDDTTSLNLGANYWFVPSLAATLDTSFSDEGNAIEVGARLNF
ncbi:outer membrane beta-barrel protein [Gilvimarinus algae]|uniref:Outer membrane protein beta-barrel domain-containing protein n=1 Tax=Gilvimarinus algae TaxID=3058037 RepID=A0ABT8TGX8_9GAMM|nr:outer membrane beta-barrel protein [Gilvimarinus sp. SDUM040014]MDO3382643.1 hypothetical protein [Gilvimarinus sp. SDUM040014]